MADSRGTAYAVAFIGLVGTIAAALITTRPWEGGSDPPRATTDFVIPSSAEAFLSLTSGPAGTTVNVSGTGFAPGEQVVIRFHTEQIGRTTAGEQGSFSNVAVVIPASFAVFAPQQFEVILTGEDSAQSAQAPFTITG